MRVVGYFNLLDRIKFAESHLYLLENIAHMFLNHSQKQFHLIEYWSGVGLNNEKNLSRKVLIFQRLLVRGLVKTTVAV